MKTLFTFGAFLTFFAVSAQDSTYTTTKVKTEKKTERWVKKKHPSDKATRTTTNVGRDTINTTTDPVRKQPDPPITPIIAEPMKTP